MDHATVKASGRVGLIVRHDPEDEHMTYKLLFADGAQPEQDWFLEKEIELHSKSASILGCHGRQHQVEQIYRCSDSLTSESIAPPTVSAPENGFAAASINLQDSAASDRDSQNPSMATCRETQQQDAQRRRHSSSSIVEGIATSHVSAAGNSSANAGGNRSGISERMAILQEAIGEIHEQHAERMDEQDRKIAKLADVVHEMRGKHVQATEIAASVSGLRGEIEKCFAELKTDVEGLRSAAEARSQTSQDCRAGIIAMKEMLATNSKRSEDSYAGTLAVKEMLKSHTGKLEARSQELESCRAEVMTQMFARAQAQAEGFAKLRQELIASQGRYEPLLAELEAARARENALAEGFAQLRQELSHEAAHSSWQQERSRIGEDDALVDDVQPRNGLMILRFCGTEAWRKTQVRAALPLLLGGFLAVAAIAFCIRNVIGPSPRPSYRKGASSSAAFIACSAKTFSGEHATWCHTEPLWPRRFSRDSFALGRPLLSAWAAAAAALRFLPKRRFPSNKSSKRGLTDINVANAE